MIFLRIFINSLKLPAKQTIFQLNRIGMDYAVLYLFILMLITSMPSLISRMQTAGEPGATMNPLIIIIYFFIFYYLPLTVMVVLLISLMAYIGTKTAKLLQRKITFPILWKITVYTTSLPFILFSVLALFFPLDDSWLALFVPYSLIFLLKIITVYPKRKKRP
ncbi:hypothetical protein GCM10008983_12340 [Lentibacillus halophilus]|uniref:DUF1189 domain-containing protein n=1 Tax=Lentibacillus halophilus TaxID=295065 RepID=A0ABN0Z7H9_9BACI